MEHADLRNISVRLHWDSWQATLVALQDLQDVHWAQPPGAPRALLHASVPCARIPSGSLPHDCDGGRDHTLMVCILKGHSPAAVYAVLECQAAARGVTAVGQAARQTMMPLRTA